MKATHGLFNLQWNSQAKSKLAESEWNFHKMNCSPKNKSV
jgi:hypothetical protein